MSYAVEAKVPRECHVLKSVALVASGAVFGFLTAFLVMRKLKRINNLGIRDGVDKVVDTVDIEEIGDKKVYCRCWKSKKFPLCDGSHNTFNKVVGDNVGPLVVKGSSE